MLASAYPQALVAQNQNTPPRLEDLIPDAAVENPEGWAVEVGDEQVTSDDASSALDPASPMAEESAIAMEWPDELNIATPEPLEPEEPSEDAFAGLKEMREQLRDENRPEREIVRIDERLILRFPEGDGFAERDEFVQRFKALSTIEELEDDEAEVAQLARRAEADQELLSRLMRIYGYYDAQVIRMIGGRRQGEMEDSVEPRVRFDILPGERYEFGAIDLGSLQTTPDAENLRAAFDIFSGQPLNSDRIVSEQRALDAELGESGYPFAQISEPTLIVDHDRAEGDLSMPVEPGGKYNFVTVTSSQPDFLSGKHLETIARFKEGDVYQRSLEMDLRRAILATGLVSSVAISKRKVAEPIDGEPGELALDVEMQKAKLRTIAGAIGYGSEDGVKIEASWEHRNLFPPEGSLKLRAIAGTREQLASIGYQRNNFLNRDQVLTIDAYASDIETDAVEARSVALRGAFERLSNLIFQKPFSWSVGAEVLWTDERNRQVDGISRPRREYLIGGIFGRATIDTSDSLLDPTEGFRLTAFFAPEVSRNSGKQTFYLRNQFDASYYQRVSDSVVMAGRGRFASVVGAGTFRIAPSRRLYAGGGGSVRGYGYQAVGPRNEFDEPTGGRSLVEASLEARIDTKFFDGALQVVPFVDMGTVALDSTPDFETVKWGAGLGIRYKTGFGPIRVDVGVPFNRDPEFDSRVAVYVSLGQAF